MAGPLERIIRSGLAYQAAAFLSAGLAFATYNAYTTAIGQTVIAQADLILAWLIFLTIFARLGFGEALLRHWYTAADAERPQLQRTIQWTVTGSTLVISLVVAGIAPWLADLLASIPGSRMEPDPGLIRIAAAGLFAYCNLDLAQALLRARDDRRTYLFASVSNVLLTVALTVGLVVVADAGVRGYLIGNYAASGVILLALWRRELPVWRGRVSRQPALVGLAAGADAPRGGAAVADDGGATGTPAADDGPGRVATIPSPADETIDPQALSEGIRAPTIESPEQTRAASRGNLRALLRFGLPTLPADAAIFAFNLLDRTLLAVLAGATALGVFSGASKIAAGVILMARAFQLAFPPLAYGIADSQQASRVYASALRGYAVVLGATVAGIALCAPWTVHVLIGLNPNEPNLRPQIVELLPLLATAWSLWGVVPVMTTIAGRLGATELTVPASVVALAFNVVALVLLIPPLGATGAALALVGAYLVLIAVLHVATRRHFPVAFDRRRILAALVITAAPCLLAGTLAPAPELGWEPAGIRLLMFAAMIVLLWRLALEPAERVEVRSLPRRLLRRSAA